MTDTTNTLGDRSVRDRVRDTLRRSPVFQVHLDLPERMRSLLDDLDRAVQSSGCATR